MECKPSFSLCVLLNVGNLNRYDDCWIRTQSGFGGFQYTAALGIVERGHWVEHDPCITYGIRDGHVLYRCVLDALRGCGWLAEFRSKIRDGGSAPSKDFERSKTGSKGRRGRYQACSSLEPSQDCWVKITAQHFSKEDIRRPEWYATIWNLRKLDIVM